MATLQNLNFVPTSIAGCALWLDAADSSTVFTSGGSITQWNDKSGNARNLIAGSGSTTYVANSVRLNASYMFVTSAVNLTNATYFIVSASPTSIFNQTVFIGRPNTTQDYQSTDGFGFYIDTTSLRLYGTGSSVIAPSVTVANRFLTAVTLASSGAMNAWINGAFSGSASTTTRGSTAQGFAIGAGWGGSAYENINSYAQINEVLTYTSVLTNAQLEQVQGYLAWKWGLVGNLPANHPYKLIAPNSAGLQYPSALSIPVPVQSMNAIANPIVAFTPTSISNCSIWLDASDPTTLTLTGSSVSQWRDKSANALLFTPPTAGQRPTLTNSPFSRAVSFTTSQTLNTTTSLTLAPTQSFFLVFSSSNTSGFYFLEHSPDTNTNDGSYFYGGNGVLYTIRRSGVTNNIYDTTVGSVIFSSNTNYIVSLVNSNNGSYIWKINGTSRSVTNFTSFTTLSGNATTPFYINNRVAATASYPEMLVYNRAVTSSEVEQIEGYLAWKWNMMGSLPSNHPYKTLPPGVNLPTRVLTLQLPILSFQPATFRPTSISGLALWLDGQDPLNTGSAPAVGTTIGTWLDKSGNGKNATGSGTPTYLSGGGISFNGTNAYYTNTSFTYNLSTRSMFIVMKVNTYLQFAGVFSLIPNPSSGNDWTTTTGLAPNTPTSSTFRVEGNSGQYTSDITATITNVNLYNDNMNGTSGSGFLNGTQSTAITAGYTAGSASGYTIGVRWLSGAVSLLYLLTGNIYEVLLYNGPVNAAQRQTIEGYLAWKWGLVGSLPATHPFKRFPPPPS